MSAQLLWLHEPAVLAMIPGDLRRHPICCNPLPDVLEASNVDDCAPAYATQDTTYPGYSELASSSEPPAQYLGPLRPGPRQGPRCCYLGVDLDASHMTSAQST